MTRTPFRPSGFCYFLRILAWLALTVGAIGTLVNLANLAGPGDLGPAFAFAAPMAGGALSLFAVAKALDLLAEIRDAAVRAAPPTPVEIDEAARRHG